jgi:hypothetical protein
MLYLHIFKVFAKPQNVGEKFNKVNIDNKNTCETQAKQGIENLEFY